MSRKSSERKKIIVIMYNAIGDFVVQSPFFQHLRNTFPDYHITAVAHRRNKKLIEQSNFFDSHISFSREDKMSVITAYISVLNKRYEYLFDMWDVQFSTFHKLLVKLIKADNKIALKKQLRKKCSQECFFDIIVAPASDLHVSKRFYTLTEAIGIESVEYPYLYPIDAEFINQADSLYKSLDNANKNVLIICVGSRYDNSIPEETILEIVDALLKKSSANIILSAEPSSKNIPDNIKASLDTERVVSLLDYSSNLDFLAAVIQKSDLVISTGTGPLHISYAFERDTVAIFPGTKQIATYWGRKQEGKYIVIYADDPRLSYPFDVDLLVEESLKLLAK